MKFFSLLILFLGLNLDLKSQHKRLFHSKDPAYTSDNHKIDPEKNLDGSSGKYHTKHKRANGKKFIKNRRTKPVRAWNGREK
ncbi:MAG: hypothetical protein JNL60_05505 [Bacteroidia bacterium]|nr:hypothetical protein [Bacteroidia bacterium]